MAETVALSEELRATLALQGLRPLIEYVAQRLGYDDGERRLHFELSNGNLRRTRLGHEPIGNDELEWLGRHG